MRLKAEASKLRAQQARQTAAGSSSGASPPPRDPSPPRDSSPPARESYAPPKTKIDRARFAAGDVLSVTGLKNRPEINGKLALVVDVKPPADANERSRYGVLVDGTRFLLKEGSLKRTPRGSSAAKKGYRGWRSSRPPLATATHFPTQRPFSSALACSRTPNRRFDPTPIAGYLRPPDARATRRCAPCVEWLAPYPIPMVEAR